MGYYLTTTESRHEAVRLVAALQAYQVVASSSATNDNLLKIPSYPEMQTLKQFYTVTTVNALEIQK